LADDRSEGWEEIASTFMALRSNIGCDVVRSWSEALTPGCSVLDLGCGSGVPIAETLIASGFQVFGIDASATLISAFRRRFPQAVAACEAAQDSPLFDRKFEGAVSVGLLFLLTAEDQRSVMRRISDALKPHGRLLFSAPRQACEWTDILTGRPSVSLGLEGYDAILQDAGMELIGSYVDDGENHYFSARKGNS
jgi:2-polyprenyl-3-methyl-5-hydroxy-6-metoxy-1,4-benzoquinol methylase